MRKKEIIECNTLEQLFEVWKREQLEESDESFYKTYFNKDIRRKYIFSKDGFIGTNDMAKVLFICREPHIGDNESCNEEKNSEFF